jgi:hypothetical protein
MPSRSQYINFNTDPSIPQGFRTRKVDQIVTRVQGEWNFASNSTNLYLSKRQKDGQDIRGYDLLNELKGKSVIGVHLSDYIKNDFYLIPPEWIDMTIFFWGTIYRNWDDQLYVFYLYWDGNAIYRGYRWLGQLWDCNMPAVISVSPPKLVLPRPNRSGW